MGSEPARSVPLTILSFVCSRLLSAREGVLVPVDVGKLVFGERSMFCGASKDPDASIGNYPERPD